jgi:integrase
VEASQKSALAANTRRTFSTGAKMFILFCLAFKLKPLPLSNLVLCGFVQFQSRTCCYSTIKTYLSGVRDWVLSMGHKWVPWSQRFPVYRTMQGIRRALGDRVRRKMAVTPELLLVLFACLDLTVENDVWLWAAMLVAFYGMFRKDNITVGKASAFNPRANLSVGDFVWHRGQLWVRVRHSKVIQFEERAHWVPLLPVPGSPLCPVTAVRRAFSQVRGRELGSPAFLWSTPRGRGPMTHSLFVSGFKCLCLKAGIDASVYSGHSFRRGGATFAFRTGVDHALIKMLGDWKSDAYLLYEQTSTERRLCLPRLMAKAILEMAK